MLRVALLISILPAAVLLLTVTARSLGARDVMTGPRVLCELSANIASSTYPHQVALMPDARVNTYSHSTGALGERNGATMTAADTEPTASRIDRPVRILNLDESGRGVANGAIVSSTEQVAAVLTDMATIGAACDALRNAGWRATISANRITVNDEVCVQYLGLTRGPAGHADASWVIYRIACGITDDNGG